MSKSDDLSGQTERKDNMLYSHRLTHNTHGTNFTYPPDNFTHDYFCKLVFCTPRLTCRTLHDVSPLPPSTRGTAALTSNIVTTNSKESGSPNITIITTSSPPHPPPPPPRAATPIFALPQAARQRAPPSPPPTRPRHTVPEVRILTKRTFYSYG